MIDKDLEKEYLRGRADAFAAVEATLIQAMERYLRVSLSGGMPSKRAANTLSDVKDMHRLSCWQVAAATYLLPKETLNQLEAQLSSELSSILGRNAIV